MIVSNIAHMSSIKRKGKKKLSCFFVWKISILLHIKIVQLEFVGLTNQIRLLTNYYNYVYFNLVCSIKNLHCYLMEGATNVQHT